MEVVDAVRGRSSASRSVGATASQRGAQLGGRHPEVVEHDAVEPLGELPQRGVATLRTAARIARTAATGPSPPIEGGAAERGGRR